MINIPILFEDGDILVIDKPVGLSVVEEEGSTNDTVRKWLMGRGEGADPDDGSRLAGARSNNNNNTPICSLNSSSSEERSDESRSDEFVQRGGIVHRLDKETSGVLLIAKNPRTFFFLKNLFSTRAVSKEYQAVVYGEIIDKRFEICAPISRSKSNGTSFAVSAEGRDSVTKFELERNFELGGYKYSELRVFPCSGRTHQIRVHLSALGHPVVNDAKYANRALLKQTAGRFNRMMLHAQKVTLTDWNNNPRIFTSSSPLC